MILLPTDTVLVQHKYTKSNPSSICSQHRRSPPLLFFRPLLFPLWYHALECHHGEKINARAASNRFFFWLGELGVRLRMFLPFIRDIITGLCVILH